MCETVELDKDTHVTQVQPWTNQYADGLAFKLSDNRVIAIGPKNYKQKQTDWEIEGSKSFIALSGKMSGESVLEVTGIFYDTTCGSDANNNWRKLKTERQSIIDMRDQREEAQSKPKDEDLNPHLQASGS